MTQKTRKSKEHPKYWLSGERAKQFRRELAEFAASGRQSNITKAHKFPLVAQQPDEKARDALRNEYYLSSAVAENTLFHYFAAFHLAGFRVFTNKSDAKVYKQQSSLLKSRLNAALLEKFDLQGNPAADLYTELEKGIRANNQTQEGVLNKLKRALNVKTDTDNDLLEKFLNEIADEIVSNGLWSPSESHRQERLNAIKTAGEKIGVQLSVSSLLPYNYCVLWDSKTVKYLHGADSTSAGLEFTMHQLVSLAAHIAAADKKMADKKLTANNIKEILLSDTGNYNGLDWLFNPRGGMRIFAQTKPEIKDSGLDIGNCDAMKLQNISEIAKSLLQNSNDYGYNYHKYRSLFGGYISSSVSNYWDRLEKLKENLDKIKCKAAPDINDILHRNEHDDVIDGFEEMALPLERVQELIDELVRQKDAARKSLQSLMGHGNCIAGKDEVECIEQFNDSFQEVKGLFIQLAEKLRVKKEAKKGDFSVARGLFQELEFLLPTKKSSDAEDEGDSYRQLKINRYTGAKVYNESQLNKELAEEYKKLAKLRQARIKHWKEIESQYPYDIIEAQEKQEEQRLGNSSENSAYITELACRNILTRLARTVSRLGSSRLFAEGVALFKEHHVFADSQAHSLFFVENKGRIYVSPFANYGHEPLSLGSPFCDDVRKATQGFIEKFYQWAQQVYDNAKTAEEIRDVALIEGAVYSLRCGGITSDNIKVKHAQPKYDELTLPVSLQYALKRETGTVTSGELARLFNAYASEINGLCARLARRNITVKSRLQHINDKCLYYAPKADKDWVLPKQLFADDGQVHGVSGLAQGWRILQQDASLYVDGQVNGKDAKIKASALPAAIEKLADKRDESGEHVFRACLRQIPHNWYYQKNKEYPVLLKASDDKHPPLLDENEKMIGLWRLDKGSVRKESNTSPAYYLRLSGTSCHKGWLDNMLSGSATLGDSSLIIEEEYQQQYDGDKDKLFAKYDKTRLELAVVFKSEAEKQEGNRLTDKFIAIDLGERGIGYAVYKVPSEGNSGQLKSPIVKGHIVLPILRKLIRKVDTYRRLKQPRQRFQSNLNTSLQQMREATIGEVAGSIEALMQKYQAFPVFESSVGGFESGGSQLKMVYGSILQLYTFSDVDAHKAKRQNHWQAASLPTWKHPFLRSKEDKPKNKGDKPLNMFPGVAVHPAYTSQTCSHCDKNPLKLIEKLGESDFPLSSDAHGILTLPLPEGGEQLYIYKRQAAKNATDNLLPAKDGVLKNYCFKKKEQLRKHIKDMLRHKPPSKNSKDTSQSSYLSPFVTVQKKLAGLSDEELKQRSCFRRNGLVFMHADINAAVNIGKKWWDEKMSSSSK